jgi:anti-sigma regulatory factor (Ser/Thr protein kinase)
VSEFDKGYEDLLRQQAQGLEGRLTFNYLSGLPLEDMQKMVAGLPDGSVVYYLVVTQDSAGNKFFPQDSLEKIASVANAPVYIWFSGHMNEKVIGGSLLDVETMANQTVELALRVLRGERPENIPIIEADSTINIKESQKEIRTFSYLLHPPMLDEAGLVQALEWYVEGFTRRSGIDVDLVVMPDVERLSSEVEIALFRIVQESLTNIHRHSGSDTAIIRFEKQADQIVLQILDHGRGMKSGNTSKEIPETLSLGVGIPGMRQRLIQLGGTLDIKSSSHGTVITATVPLTNKREVKHDSHSVGR